MNTQQQIVEGQTSVDRNHDLAVENELLRLERLNRLDDLREIARKRLSRLGLNRDGVAGAEDDRAKAIPLRLELPMVAERDLVQTLRFHRRKRRLERQIEFR